MPVPILAGRVSVPFRPVPCRSGDEPPPPSTSPGETVQLGVSPEFARPDPNVLRGDSKLGDPPPLPPVALLSRSAVPLRLRLLPRPEPSGETSRGWSPPPPGPARTTGRSAVLLRLKSAMGLEPPLFWLGRAPVLELVRMWSGAGPGLCGLPQP